MNVTALRSLIISLLAISSVLCSRAQDPPPNATASDDTPVEVKKLPGNLLHDQYRIWTSPAHLKFEDATWLVPIAGVTAGLFVTDHNVARTVSAHTGMQSKASTLSNGGLALELGTAGGFYLWGSATHDEHKRETGLLSTEAAANALAVTEVFKVVLGRERPFENTDGRFFRGGSSFPSGHATLSFSVASVIAHEYPGPATQVLAYGVATAVSVSRVAAFKHFPADVAVGGTLGYLIGRYTYRAHHNTDLLGAQWGTFESREKNRSRGGASNYVALDSWVYPALDRLIAMGAIQSGFLSMRPWTRMECARVLDEAEAVLPEEGELYNLSQRLRQEFAPELANLGEGTAPAAQIESVYARFGQITGPALTDSYHFEQTVVNDFGRPNRQGGNLVTGLSARANAGAFVFYVRGEYQQSPQTHGFTQQAEDAIAFIDQTPVQSPRSLAPVRQFRVLDSYVGWGIGQWLLTFGKQSLWWAPTRTTALMFTNNAEPIPMFRVSQTQPAALPGFLKWLGPLRTEFFFGRLQGQKFVAPQFLGTVDATGRQPYIHGERISFKPTENFEFGVSRTGILGGPELPLTLRTIARSYLKTTNVTAASDPGDRRSGFDFSYKIPGLRNWLSFYADTMTEDEISPLGYPRKSAINPGIYLPKLPKLNRVDLRLEAAYTDAPSLQFNGFFYWNDKYRSGYTSRGNIMGTWVGREGRAITATSTFWMAADKTLNLRYRHAEASSDFLQGGRLDDGAVTLWTPLKGNLYLLGALQVERWGFPLLSPTKKTNVNSSIELRYLPHRHRD